MKKQPLLAFSLQSLSFSQYFPAVKGEELLMLPATATYINTQLTIYLPNQGETFSISTFYKNQWFL